MEMPMKKAIKLKIDTSKTPEQIGIFDSKIGGAGYFKEDGTIPTEESGDQLRLLAQINFTDLRQKVELPSELNDKLPKSGLLQFWLSTDDCSGCDLGGIKKQTVQNGFRVIYYDDSELVQWSSDKDIFRKAEKATQYSDEEFFPVLGNKEYAVTYEVVDSEYIDYSEFDEKYSEKERNAIYKREIGHKIGGYPYFVQTDPREDYADELEELGDKNNYDFLILQTDSDFIDGKDIILWGDCGCSQFLISSENLKKLNFNDVLYNWDCG